MKVALINKYIILALALFFCASNSSTLFAYDYSEDFSGFTEGPVDGQFGWEIDGESEHSIIVNENTNKSLEITSSTSSYEGAGKSFEGEQVSTNGSIFSVDLSLEDFRDVPASNVIIGFSSNTVDIIFSIGFSYDPEEYNYFGIIYNGGPLEYTTFTVLDSEVFKLTFEFQFDDQQFRLKKDEGSWSSYSFGETAYSYNSFSFLTSANPISGHMHIDNIFMENIEPMSVPEPGTIIMMLLGLCGYWYRRKKI